MRLYATADKAKLAAGANYHANIFAHAAEEQNRAESVWSVKEGCMAAKGYVRVPETQAPQIAAMLGATKAERDKAGSPHMPGK